MSSGLHDDDTEVTEACEAPATPAREVPDIPFGVTRGMSNEDYHGDRSAVSSTQLKRMLISPAHFLSGITDPEESTEALLFGSVLHGRLLEPDTFDSRFFAMPKVNRARKEGKQRYAECMVQAAGRTVYPEAWKEPIERIIDNAMTHRKARELLAKGEAEVALVWLDPDTGIKCKIKIDWWHDARTLADVKSAEDVTFEGFRRSCARLGYALSAAMYCEGVYQLTGEEPEWAFIACEKARPNTVAVYRAMQPMLEAAPVQAFQIFTWPAVSRRPSGRLRITARRGERTEDDPVRRRSEVRRCARLDRDRDARGRLEPQPGQRRSAQAHPVPQGAAPHVHPQSSGAHGAGSARHLRHAHRQIRRR